MKNVTILTPFFWPQNNGVANYVGAVCLNLVDKGMNVTVITSDAEGEHDLSVDIKVIRLKISGGFNLSNPIKGIWKDIPAIINNSNPSVVICHCAQTWATDVPLLFVRRINAPVIYHSHCISTGYIDQGSLTKSIARYFAWAPYRIFQKYLLMRCAGALFLSQSGRDGRCSDGRWLTANSGRPTEVVGAGFNSLFDQVAGQHRSELYVLAVLDATYLKGLDSILRSYRLSGVSSKYKLMIHVHKMTPWAKKILEEEIKAGLDPNAIVIKEGEGQDSVMASYQNARCLVSASRTECLPLVLIDCLGAEIPFVAKRTGHVESIPGGIVCDTVLQLAEHITELCDQESLTHHDLKIEMIKARSQYSWDAVADRHMAFFQKLSQSISSGKN